MHFGIFSFLLISINVWSFPQLFSNLIPLRICYGFQDSSSEQRIVLTTLYAHTIHFTVKVDDFKYLNFPKRSLDKCKTLHVPDPDSNPNWVSTILYLK